MFTVQQRNAAPEFPERAKILHQAIGKAGRMDAGAGVRMACHLARIVDSRRMAAYHSGLRVGVDGTKIGNMVGLRLHT